jgi:hypothetical protein
MSLLLLVALAIAPVDSLLGWIGVVLLWPGPLLAAGLYLLIRGLRHRRIHARYQPCPWCHQSEELHTLPRAVREQRDRLRERLVRSEHHVD